MRKFFAVLTNEYRKIVLKWTFLIGTLLFPVLGLVFAFVPALIFSLTGEPTRLVIVDPTGKLAPRIKSSLSAERLAERAEDDARSRLKEITEQQSNDLRSSARSAAVRFIFVNYDATGRTADEVRNELKAMATAKEIDAYLILPTDPMAPNAEPEFRSRKGGDFVANTLITEAVNDAVRSQRLADAEISEATARRLNSRVVIDSAGIDEKGNEKNSDALLAASFVIGLMIYITLAIYGQVIMGAIVEEKETRIAEILFSSARPFELMMGKLVGVGLAGLTQLGIWVGSLSVLVAYVAVQVDMSEIFGLLPTISPVMVVYFLVYFLIGYFLYASIFALIGSAVTTVQEGGQFAFPPMMLMLVGFYLSIAVIRDPASPIAFWASVLPFFAPLTMPVRILAETPPFWQIALSIALNLIAIAGLVFLASRVYRVGMLMYGKRATIPEILKWIRQA